MGFERVTSMIQGTKGFTDFENAKISNYETDVFRPLFERTRENSPARPTSPPCPKSAQNSHRGRKSRRRLPRHRRPHPHPKFLHRRRHPARQRRPRLRLRRILPPRRPLRPQPWPQEPFLGKLVDVLGATMGHVFPEVVAKAELIKKTLTNEEESFFRRSNAASSSSNWLLKSETS